MHVTGPIRCGRCEEPVLSGTHYACLEGEGCWHAACVLLVEDEELRARLEERLRRTFGADQ